MFYCVPAISCRDKIRFRKKNKKCYFRQIYHIQQATVKLLLILYRQTWSPRNSSNHEIRRDGNVCLELGALNTVVAVEKKKRDLDHITRVFVTILFSWRRDEACTTTDGRKSADRCGRG